MAGKGDRYRPVNQQKYDTGWEKAFVKNKKEDNHKKIDEQLMEKMNRRMHNEDLND